jgi:hypothetical protein
MRAANGGASSPIIKLGVTNRRIFMFSTSHGSEKLSRLEIESEIPLIEIASVESSTGFVMGMNHLKIGMTLKDGSELAFEASGFAFKAAKELASALEDVVS